MEEIVILHTNDLHSHLEQWPKIRRYLLNRKKELVATGRMVVTVDLGDFSDRVHPLTEATDGLENVLLMNQVHYDGATIGNNEGVGNSKAQLNHLYDNANFDLVLANLEDPVTQEPPEWTQPFKLITSEKGTRVALIGLTAPFHLTYEPNGWTIYQTDQVLPAILDELKGEADIIVLMSHLGIEEETRIAKVYPEIDVVLGSHTHHLFTDGMVVGQTMLAAAGKFGRYIGEVELQVSHNRLASVTAQVQEVELLPALASDQREVAGYLSQGYHLLTEQVVGSTPLVFSPDLNGAHPLIELALSAVSEYAGTEVALLNSGLFLTELGGGKITQDDLHRCLPHPMHLIKVTMLGKDILQLVAEIVEQQEKLIKFPIVGMGFRGKVFGELRSQGLAWANPEAVTWLEKPLVLTEYYTFVTVDHLLFIPFFPSIGKTGKIEMLFPEFIRTVLGDYINEHYPCDSKKDIIN